jgi:nicotinamidase-related amidase
MTPEAPPGKYALLVIDLQQDLCHAPARRALVDAALPNIQALIDKWHRSGWPIFYSRFELPPDDPQFTRFGDRYCVRDTPGAEFIQEILPLRGTVVVKRKHSAFFDTTLDEQLREQSCDGVVLSGLQTQICILTTAADAHHRDYHVIAAEDGVISTRDEVRLDALHWIRKYVGITMTTSQLVALR